MQSKAKTVAAYLESLDPDDTVVVSALRQVVLKHLPKGYEEHMNWGMITYEIPLKRYPKTYNGQPLGYVAIAAQKNHFGLYMMCLNADTHASAAFEKRWKGTGKKLDMGKSCIRFQKLEDLPLDVIGEAVASTSVDEYIAIYEKARGL